MNERHFTPVTENKQRFWEELYNTLKNNPNEILKDSNGKNPLNTAIIANALPQLLELLINRQPELVSQPSPEGNYSLHFLLGRAVNSTEDKRMYHKLVRKVIEIDPSIFYNQNKRGLTPINLINRQDYTELRNITNDALLDGDINRLDHIILNLNDDILIKLKNDKNLLKNTTSRIFIKAIDAVITERNNILFKHKEQLSQQASNELLREEENKRLHALKRAEITEKVRLAQIEQERKHQAAITLQKGYRGSIERRKYQEHLKQKGLNKKAIPFIPVQKEQRDPLLDVLPTDDEIAHPWRYDTHTYGQNFAFGNSLQTLKKDLKKLRTL